MKNEKVNMNFIDPSLNKKKKEAALKLAIPKAVEFLQKIIEHTSSAHLSKDLMKFLMKLSSDGTYLPDGFLT
jgi:hypothetical protein